VAISSAISIRQPQYYLSRAAISVHASDICYLDPSEAIKLMLAAFVLASVAFAGCFAIIMSR
jgi:hypothetical protein